MSILSFSRPTLVWNVEWDPEARVNLVGSIVDAAMVLAGAAVAKVVWLVIMTGELISQNPHSSEERVGLNLNFDFCAESFL